MFIFDAERQIVRKWNPSAPCPVMREKILLAIRERNMGRGLLLWLIGIPLPIILIIWLLGGLH
jgi:hypothetical protein